MVTLILILFSILFIPTFNIGGFPLRVEDLFIVGSFAYYFPKIKIRNKQFLYLVKIFIGFIFINLVSLFFSILDGYDVGLQDLNTILLYVKALIAIVVGYYLANSTESLNFNTLLLTLSTILCFSSIIAVIQYFNLFGVGEALYLLFGSEDRIIYGVSRAIGTLGNPNYAAYFHGLGFVFAINLKPTTKLIRIFRVLLTTLCLFGVLLTFSRTGIVAIFIVWFTNMLMKKKMGYLIFSFSLVIFILLYYLDRIVEGTRWAVIFQQGSLGFGNFGNRSDLIWKIRLQDFIQNPVLGVGPAKNMLSGTAFGSTTYDNTFILLLITSGILGFIFYMYFIYKTLFYFRKGRTKEFSQLKITYTGLTLLTLIFFSSTDLIWNIKFVSFFYLTLGYFCFSYTSINNNSKALVKKYSNP